MLSINGFISLNTFNDTLKFCILLDIFIASCILCFVFASCLLLIVLANFMLFLTLICSYTNKFCK